MSPNYQTARLGLAAYLIARGDCSLVEVNRLDDSRFQFTLTPSPLTGKVQSYFDGSGHVSALAYNNTLSNLKAALFEAKRSQRRSPND